jgi:hypothetical protein
LGPLAGLPLVVKDNINTVGCPASAGTPSRDIEQVAVGSSIRDLPRLRKLYGRGRWRKQKGVASVRLADGTL